MKNTTSVSASLPRIIGSISIAIIKHVNVPVESDPSGRSIGELIDAHLTEQYNQGNAVQSVTLELSEPQARLEEFHQHSPYARAVE